MGWGGQGGWNWGWVNGMDRENGGSGPEGGSKCAHQILTPSRPFMDQLKLVPVIDP